MSGGLTSALVSALPYLLQGKQFLYKTTGWSIFDPFEPLLAFAFMVFAFSWFASFLGVMTFYGYVPTIMLGIALSRVHFLGSFKENLDKFAAENKRFRAANKDLKASVSNLQEQNKQLDVTNKRLQTSISQLDEVRETIKKYAEHNNADLGNVLSSLHESIAEQKKIQKDTERIQIKTRQLTSTQERAMLMNLFMQFQNQDGEKGLSVDEFETLVDMLPADSAGQLRDGMRDFKKFDTDGDGIISIKNFRDGVMMLANSRVDETGGQKIPEGVEMSKIGRVSDARLFP
eukprot:TRINITY_DN3210_c1_g3_i1.p1 TRINITY_DN3210_c1_g3~~TRINITY_DN3210_c1_g3_i1.p1  ORF type:complete len:288 (-),score=47.02 TRINITY_DN3210_c1_g3_i1:86-949(-)